MVRALGGWPEIALSAANHNLVGNTLLATIIDSARDRFEAAGLIGASEGSAKVEETEGAE